MSRSSVGSSGIHGAALVVTQCLRILDISDNVVKNELDWFNDVMGTMRSKLIFLMLKLTGIVIIFQYQWQNEYHNLVQHLLLCWRQNSSREIVNTKDRWGCSVCLGFVHLAVHSITARIFFFVSLHFLGKWFIFYPLNFLCNSNRRKKNQFLSTVIFWAMLWRSVNNK